MLEGEARAGEGLPDRNGRADQSAFTGADKPQADDSDQENTDSNRQKGETSPDTLQSPVRRWLPHS
jgi:hypothetical protein